MDRGFPPWELEPGSRLEPCRSSSDWPSVAGGCPAASESTTVGAWGALGDFPTELALWLIGPGVAMHWNNPRRPQENGVIERSQETSARWCEPWTCRSPAELQSRLERMDRLYREVYPYRNRRSRLEVFPNLVHTGRPYDRAAEARLWEWSRVTQHLAGIVPLRRVDQSGKVSIYNKGHYVGYLDRGKDVSALLMCHHAQQVQSVRMLRFAAEHLQVELSRLVRETLLMFLQGQAEGVVHGVLPLAEPRPRTYYRCSWRQSCQGPRREYRGKTCRDYRCLPRCPGLRFRRSRPAHPGPGWR